MCIITDNQHIVISISIIPGLGTLPSGFHVYFPVTGDLPGMGEIYKPKRKGEF